jgi:hypothetical protein
LPEVRGEEERDSAFSVQRGEWVEQRRFGQAIRRILKWRWQLLRRRVRLQLGSWTYGTAAEPVLLTTA